MSKLSNLFLALASVGAAADKMSRSTAGWQGTALVSARLAGKKVLRSVAGRVAAAQCASCGGAFDPTKEFPGATICGACVENAGLDRAEEDES
jgi:hypothetical protein